MPPTPVVTSAEMIQSPVAEKVKTSMPYRPGDFSTATSSTAGFPEDSAVTLTVAPLTAAPTESVIVMSNAPVPVVGGVGETKSSISKGPSRAEEPPHAANIERLPMRIRSSPRAPESLVAVLGDIPFVHICRTNPQPFLKSLCLIKRTQESPHGQQGRA